jgi:hypothetical protein
LSNEDFYMPTDTDSLRMENELLRFEVRFLKAQIAQTERLKARLTECEHRLEESLKESKRSKQAERDLTLLLRSLVSSPLGPFLRLKQSFRALERRYLWSSKS